jgi:four helix bundle protein
MQQAKRGHRDLVLWQKSLDLAVDIHRLTRSFPPEERFGLTSQMRRAAVSVASNVAEGAARRTTKDFVAFLHVARGSLAELETQLLLAEQIGYLNGEQCAQQMSRLDEVGKLLTSFLAGLRRRVAALSTIR